jgi:uncharacterized Ntn-hydrolase superfamily protein
MKTILFLLLFFSTFVSFVHAQDTFSIVAADSATRETASAGASCVDLYSAGYNDATFLGDLLPDTGAINSQASYLAANQNNARARMRAGDTPAQIIDWLVAHDVQNNPTIRQYGIVGFTGSSVSDSGFTGVNCLDYKNNIGGSINGIYYSIQGNILLGKKVLDSMETRFRRAHGDLACRLMAALQGAKMIGADTRCAPDSTSTLFAFIKVAQPTDTYGAPSFKLSVKTHIHSHIEPIDSLQVLFDLQHSCTSTGIKVENFNNELKVYPNPTGIVIVIKVNSSLAGSRYTITDLFGRSMMTGKMKSETESINIQQLSAGMYFVQVENAYRKRFVKK